MSKTFDKIPNVVFDALRLIEQAEKMDKAGFTEFLESKSSSSTVQTDNQIFNEASFNADLKAIEDKYNSETSWLKEHMPKSPEEMSKWNQRLQARDSLRNTLPNKNDPKYYSKETVVVTKSGHECKSLLEQFKAEYDKLSEEYHKKALESYIKEHEITMDEEAFSFIKMMDRLGQVNSDFIGKIPTMLIHKGAAKIGVRADLEKALLYFNTVSEYNESLKLSNVSLNDEEMKKLKDKQISLMNDDLKLAAHALSSYTCEFIASKKIV